MLKLSSFSRYAVKALVYLAKQKKDQPVPAHVIAEATGLAEPFLMRAIGRLATAQLVYALKGPNGGCRLAKAPKEITLLAIVEAVDGPVRGQVSSALNGDDDRTTARLEAILDQLADLVRRDWQKIKVSDLARK